MNLRNLQACEIAGGKLCFDPICFDSSNHQQPQLCIHARYIRTYVRIEQPQQCTADLPDGNIPSGRNRVYVLAAKTQHHRVLLSLRTLARALMHEVRQTRSRAALAS